MRHIIKELGFRSVNAAAKAWAIPVSTLQTSMSRNTMSRTTAALIAKNTPFAALWIERGTGPMREEKPHSAAMQDAMSSSPLCTVVDPLSAGEHVTSQFDDQGGGDEKTSVRTGAGASFSMVPKAQTKLSAGGGILPEEGTTGEEYAFRLDWLKQVATSTSKVILVDVDGDSMAPTLLDKDTVLIDLGRTDLRDGRIYAIAVGDVVQIKRLQRLTADRIRIISDNPTYYTYEARPDELRIIGQMIWYARTTI